MNKLITIILLFASVVAFGQGATPNLRDGLVGYWKFEEASGTTAIDQKQDNDGTISGATVNQTGKVGQCYDFNGTTSVINTNLSTHYTDLSFSAWIYLDSYGEGGLGRVFDKRANGGSQVLLLYVSGSPYYRLEFAVQFSSALGQWKGGVSTIGLSGWYHICLTYNSASTTSNPILYVNGISTTFTETSTPSGTVSTNTNSYYIGNRGDLGRTFDGKIDEVMIYNRILSPLEVKQLYNSDNGLLFVQENFKNDYNYEKFISYFIHRDYFTWITGANY